jgi:hypothetical protein
LHNIREACGEVVIQRRIRSPSEEHMGSWNSISQDDVTRKIPRHAVIHTQPCIDDDNPGTEDQFSEGMEGALAALSKFPSLDSVEIGFTPQCAGVYNDWSDVAGEASERKEMSTFIFTAIVDRAANVENMTVRKLTIINLQNCDYSKFTSSSLFRDVMYHLKKLHISITQEQNLSRPNNDYNAVELQTFPAHFCLD